MHERYKTEILKLKSLPYIDPSMILCFLERINRHDELTRSQNRQNHFCSMVLPYAPNDQTVLLGYHKKAEDWIPPGGHIEGEETPFETALRETGEELSTSVHHRDLELCNITCLLTNKPSVHGCQIHYDFWYVLKVFPSQVHLDSQEFSESRWVPIIEAIQLVKRPEYKVILNNVFYFN